MKNRQLVLIVDFGSQYCQIIARRVRECSVYCEIVNWTISIEEIKAKKPIGLILSGGPSSVYEEGSPSIDINAFSLGIPILGICYGMQLMARINGGCVIPGEMREFGYAKVSLSDDDLIFNEIPRDWSVWMSHNDIVSSIPIGFKCIGMSENGIPAIIKRENLYGVQFHPEVEQTACGLRFLDNFLKLICNATGDWSPESFIDNKIMEIRDTVKNQKVILGYSGGVDSSVAALLLNKAIGDQLICIFIDNGLLRLNERNEVKRNAQININVVDAEERFMRALEGINEPEAKRKCIGRVFIEVFDEEVEKIRQNMGATVSFLAQGTIYPDVIESKAGATIKSHHNVGGLPEKMNLKIIEPLRELFKDEVRKIGKLLGIPETQINRHPFPGPGLGIRVIGEVSIEKCDILRKADSIFIEELYKANMYNQMGQAFVVLLPVKSVGVMGDVRTYEYVACLRAVETTDFMTAKFAPIDFSFLGKVSNRIINEVKGINRVCYDISSKPPATIEWE